MTQRDFLRNLRREHKLMLVAPSPEIAGSYLAKSDSFLDSARILREAEHLEEAVSMAYYSMYHAMTALLIRAGIRCENHAGAIMLLEELFGMDISALDDAKRMRVDTQYYVDRTITLEDVEELIRVAGDFHDLVHDRIDRITGDEIARVRKMMERILK
jgi:uncharacterized protein (UPF0332 family)